MLTKYKKIDFNDKKIAEEIIFEKNNQITIYRYNKEQEINKKDKNKNSTYIYEYGFEIKNKIFTSDIMEAISYLIKNPKLYDNSIWDLQLNIDVESYYNQLNPGSSLYWLSGGDEFWNNPEYDATWTNNVGLYLDKFEPVLLNVLQSSKSFGELRNKIYSQLNLDVFYEFALEHKIR